MWILSISHGHMLLYWALVINPGHMHLCLAMLYDSLSYAFECVYGLRFLVICNCMWIWCISYGHMHLYLAKFMIPGHEH